MGRNTVSTLILFCIVIITAGTISNSITTAMCITTNNDNPSSSSSSPPSPSTQYRLRRFDETKKGDVNGILKLFRDNLTEEWTKYHDGKYLPNALKYVDKMCSEETGDLRNIKQVYFDNGGYFWVLVRTSDSSDDANIDTNNEQDDDEVVCGTVGLEKLSETKVEVRRMCLIPSLRRNGWGTKMFRVLEDKVVEMGNTNIDTIICSTPEHGDDVLKFYQSLGFKDTGKREPIHNSPIQEVFLEKRISAAAGK